MIRLRGARWCSMTCRREWEAKRVARRWTNCRQCGVRYQREQQYMGRPDAGKFCSRGCYYAHKAANSRLVTLPCATCGRSVARWLKDVRRARNVYCSRECLGASRVRLGSVVSRGPGWVKLREVIRERDGRCCVRCGDPEPANKRLAVDHIIPWLLCRSDPAIANDPRNLASLCLKCHGVKTTVVEPALFKGDLLSLRSFYGERGERAHEFVYGQMPDALGEPVRA